jgi:hypothetical protein
MCVNFQDVEVRVVRNKYKVPLKQWKKWSLDSKLLFNLVYSQMVNNQFLYTHPKGIINKQWAWRTTAYNAAWTAAETLRGKRTV